MSFTPSELWNAWRTMPVIQQTAEAWITKRPDDWTKDDERLYGLFQANPDQALAIICAAMQLTDDKGVLGGLAAGPLENFLGVHGQAYLDIIHTLALEHQRLREVLDCVWQGAMSKHVWHRIEALKQKPL
jgi:hypothetical protein